MQSRVEKENNLGEAGIELWSLYTASAHCISYAIASLAFLQLLPFREIFLSAAAVFILPGRLRNL